MSVKGSTAELSSRSIECQDCYMFHFFTYWLLLEIRFISYVQGLQSFLKMEFSLNLYSTL